VGAARFILTKAGRRIPSPRVSAGDSDGLRSSHSPPTTMNGATMKTILALSVVLLVAGCQKRAATPAADTSAMAPAMSDTGMGGMTHSDSTMARDTAKK
jgi:hypothetical protein